jgi:hypothetical protein
MDFGSESEGKDILEALLWVQKGKFQRDLRFLKHHATDITNSATHSTLDSGNVWDIDNDENQSETKNQSETEYKLGTEFTYLAPLLESINTGGNIMEKSDQAGEQSQESERMEME